MLDEIGRGDFNRLHARAARRGRYQGRDPVTLCAFDLLVDGGRNIMGLCRLSSERPACSDCSLRPNR